MQNFILLFILFSFSASAQLKYYCNAKGEKTNKTVSPSEDCVDCSVRNFLSVSDLSRSRFAPSFNKINCALLKRARVSDVDKNVWNEIVSDEDCSTIWDKVSPYIHKNSTNKRLSLKMDYPYESIYSYVKGYQPREGKANIPAPSLAAVNKQIELAVSYGIDPEMALAISEMENPFYISVLNRHTHDGPGAKALGCRGGQAGRNTLQRIKWKNPERLKTLAKAFNRNSNKSEKIVLKPGKSWVCGDKHKTKEIFNDYDGFSISAEPKDDRYCCVSVPYDMPKTSAVLPSRVGRNVWNDFITHAITFEKLRGMQTKNVAPNGISKCGRKSHTLNKPEYRVQNFLGYSLNLGTGMQSAVSAFRMGVNSCAYPNYGYQAMDYIVNSIAPNPVVQRLIAKAKKRYNTSFPSILCMDKTKGTHTTSKSKYFNLHKNAPRFSYLKHKLITQGINVTDMTPIRHLQPIGVELNIPHVKKELFKHLTDKEKSHFGKLAKKTTIVSYKDNAEMKKILHGIVKKYFKYVHPNRNTISKASVQDYPNLSWKEYTAQEKAAYEKKFNEAN